MKINTSSCILLLTVSWILLNACQNSVTQANCFSGIPDGFSVRCGSIDVPEDYTDTDGKTINLNYAVVHRDGTNAAPDPLVFLAGGPGERVLDNTAIAAFAPYLETRDVIFFDQRGVGKAEPTLDCPEHREAILAFAETSDPAVEIEGVRACLTRLQTDGVKLAAYTTANNARDLDAIRQALGYEYWNLLGSSYGTQLAMTAARDTPAGIRAIILDSVYPVEKSLYDERAVYAAAALDAVFDACSDEATCEAAFPELRATFNQVVEQLNANPAAVLLTTETGQVLDAQLTGDMFASLIYNMLYASSTIQRIPQVIADTADGNFASIHDGVARYLLLLDNTTYGMQFAILCNDEIPFDEPGNVQATHYPALDVFMQTRKEVIMSICEGFSPETPPAIQNQSIITAIPTLIIAGKFDPVTPWQWAETLHRSLPNSFFFQYPSLSHGISIDACPAQMATAFLENPTTSPNDYCIDTMQMGKFTIRAEEYILVPFISQGYGISGVYPEAWIHREEADFYQDESRFTSLIYINYREKTLEQVMQQILPSYQLETAPPLMRTYATKTLTFNIYQFVWQGRLTITLAVAEKGGDTYMVALASPISDHSSLYELVLIPALDVLELIPAS